MAAKEPLRYLRWAPDGRKLFVFGATPLPITGLREPFPEGMSAPTGVATIDLKSRQVSWLNLFNPWFAGEVYAGQYATVQEGSWVQIKGQLPDVEPVRVLFGSQRHPVMAPLLAPGLPSFFYIQYGEGWFWKTALMRYDIAQDSLTDIRTLARGIFSE